MEGALFSNCEATGRVAAEDSRWIQIEIVPPPCCGDSCYGADRRAGLSILKLKSVGDEMFSVGAWWKPRIKSRGETKQGSVSVDMINVHLSRVSSRKEFIIGIKILWQINFFFSSRKKATIWKCWRLIGLFSVREKKRRFEGLKNERVSSCGGSRCLRGLNFSFLREILKWNNCWWSWYFFYTELGSLDD